MDINCDLGEGEPLARTRALMRWITSANVACGGHAGGVCTMRDCARLCHQHGVRLGAHPGSSTGGNFGRGEIRVSADELELLLLQQVGALQRIAGEEGVRLHHVKLHGALYHAAEADPSLARRYVQAIRRWWPNCRIYARPNGRVARLASRHEVSVWGEAFADRAYADDGALVPRSRAGALLTERAQVIRRALLVRDEGAIETVTGRRLAVRARTLCIHSDTPGASSLARAVALIFRRQIAP